MIKNEVNIREPEDTQTESCPSGTYPGTSYGDSGVRVGCISGDPNIASITWRK